MTKPDHPNESDSYQADQEARKELRSLLSDNSDLSIEQTLKNITALTKAADQKVFIAEGKFKYTKKLPNHRVRLETNKLVLTLHDAMPSEKHDHHFDNELTIEVRRTIIEGEAS